jgi:hypothetical protein
MKHATAPTNEKNEIVNSLQFQINFNSDFMDHGNKEPSDKPFTLKEVLFKKTKGKKSMFLNIFQPSMKIVQQYYNNVQKSMFYSNIWISKLKFS